VAEELLRAEGFTDVQYVKVAGGPGLPAWRALASGEVQLNTAFSGPLLMRIETGDPIVLLAGIHVGCFELFGTERVRSIRDLKGKAVAIPTLEGVHHVFIASMATYVGVDPKTDISWVTLPPAEAKQQLAAGQVDAYLGFPPDPQELRARQVGHVIVNSNVDRPWSQYFCCTLVANREFVKTYPVATKRALRAILKATDICASEPERVAEFLVDKGYTAQRDYALQALKGIPFNRWREYDAEDTVRFYALRLHEAGMLKSTPQKIIAQGTDWRFLNELKKELKQ
jgi:NitT/TauT family transport system substrate-binding protein